MQKKFLFGVIASILIGCNRPHYIEEVNVPLLIERRIQKKVSWHQDKQYDDLIQNLLAQEISAESAVQIAILNNPSLQAVFEDIGIAEADLIEAGLLHNPVFDGFIRFPYKKDVHVNSGFSFSQSFLDAFFIPSKVKIASNELEIAKWRVANAILDLSFDVQSTYYKLVAEQKKEALMKTLVEVSKATSELATLQKRKGNISDLELQHRSLDYSEKQLLLSNTTLEVICLREHMNQLLGLPKCTFWKVSSDLSSLLSSEETTEDLTALALSQNIEITIARQDVERLAQLQAIPSWSKHSGIALGVSHEKDAEGDSITGPTLSATLPFFNYGQADRLRLDSIYRQKVEKLKNLEHIVTSNVRAAHEQALILREMVSSYQDTLFPLKKKIVTMSQRFYNVMALSVYKLLQEKQEEIEMEINYTTLLRNYWLAQVEVERNLSGNYQKKEIA
jgi:cobalt-zinc-cadmium efflux system outer membrane protein